MQRKHPALIRYYGRYKSLFVIEAGDLIRASNLFGKYFAFNCATLKINSHV